MKNVDTFEDIKESKIYMQGMVERIRKIKTKEELGGIGIESLTVAMELLDVTKGTMLHDSVAQVLHITVRFFEAYAKYDDPAVMAQYIADHHEVYLEEYLKHLNKQMLEKTKKGDGDYVN